MRWPTRTLIRCSRMLCLGLLLLYSSVAPGNAQANETANEVRGARVHKSPDYVRVVFDLRDATSYAVGTVKARAGKPYRVFIDVPRAALVSKDLLSRVPLAGTGVAKLRSGRTAERLRIVLDLDGRYKPRHFTLPPVAPYDHRLVVDLYPETSSVDSGDSGATGDSGAGSGDSVTAATGQAGAPAPASTDNQPVQSIETLLQQRRDITIAIDAGHGGEDPGAVGTGGVREKDVVMAIARKMAATINGKAGYKAVLIRDGDYYVGLRKRTRIARQRDNADLFVSIHADAFRSAAAKGASVYTLSDGGASSETARWLAEKENRADLIGGVSLDDKDDTLAGVLLDLSMTATLRDSMGAGKAVLSELGAVTRLHSSVVGQAGFAVLKSPDVPSMLIETGYISNPEEARKLSTPAYQSRLAQAIVRGISAWFEENPPPGTLLAAMKNNKTRLLEYTIVRGDTLSAIAARHGVALGRLKTLNNLAGDRIRVGQRLKIPL